MHRILKKSLAEALHSMRPLHPRIMSYIYEPTPVGVAQSITRRLESTYTLETVMMNNQDSVLKQWEMTEINDNHERNIINSKNLTDLHYIFELTQFMSIINILNNKHPDINLIHECSTKMDACLRKESWGDVGCDCYESSVLFISS